MLVLSRKLGESIQVGNATITVVRLGESTVNLAVEAPDDVPIHRSELEDKARDVAHTLVWMRNWFQDHASKSDRLPDGELCDASEYFRARGEHDGSLVHALADAADLFETREVLLIVGKILQEFRDDVMNELEVRGIPRHVWHPEEVDDPKQIDPITNTPGIIVARKQLCSISEIDDLIDLLREEADNCECTEAAS